MKRWFALSQVKSYFPVLIDSILVADADALRSYEVGF